MTKALSYVSRSLVDRKSVEFLDIVRECMRNNPREEITGALYFDDLHFFQIIEGAAARIDALMERIARDGRHCDLQVLDELAIETRLFARWDMKFVDGARYAHLGHAFSIEALRHADPPTLRKRLELLARL